VTTVALCAICHDREQELYRMLDSTSAEPWDEVIVLDMASAPPVAQGDRVHWLRSESNVGPAGGRNRLAAAATSDILVFIDDDARLLSPARETVVRLFEENPRLAVTAFRIQRPDGRMVSEEYPFRGRMGRATDRRPCSYFVAAGYACRRSAVDAVGGYDESLFMNGEELELSFKLLGAGWQLLYEPAVVIEHCPAAAGRMPAPMYWPVTMRNRSMIARTYLPVAAQLIHLACWMGLTLRRAAATGGLRPWPGEVLKGLRAPVHRQRLPWPLLRQVHAMGGRVFW
jgi:GT2 family glycosyltransferase